jgi:hypothetical protein
LRSYSLDVEYDEGTGQGDNWVRDPGWRWRDFRRLVGGFAELSASEMWQLAPRSYDSYGISNDARAVLVFVAQNRKQYHSKRQSAFFHKRKYNFVIFSVAQATFLSHAIYPSPNNSLNLLS